MNITDRRSKNSRYILCKQYQEPEFTQFPTFTDTICTIEPIPQLKNTQEILTKSAHTISDLLNIPIELSQVHLKKKQSSGHSPNTISEYNRFRADQDKISLDLNIKKKIQRRRTSSSVTKAIVNPMAFKTFDSSICKYRNLSPSKNVKFQNTYALETTVRTMPARYLPLAEIKPVLRGNKTNIKDKSIKNDLKLLHDNNYEISQKQFQMEKLMIVQNDLMNNIGIIRNNEKNS